MDPTPTGSPGTVDWESLLRPPQTSSPPSPHLAGKRILITGAGGSLGSALARAAVASSPAGLVLLDTSEAALYDLDRTLDLDRHLPAAPPRASILGSVADRDLLPHLFRRHRPQIVLHAAALKHVPLMERNPFAAIATNALGTLALAGTAAAFGAERLLLLSTDKAVDPASILGASKRIAELAVLALGAATGTRMTAVRLGNVAGTQGSVLPLFAEQIARGGPLTVTDAAAQRFFIPLDRAVATLLAALAHPARAALLLPDLGAPVRILDLARHLLARQAGEAAVRFTGPRPGDKTTESLVSARERLLAPASPGGLGEIVTPVPPPATLHAAAAAIEEALGDRNLADLLAAIARLVPEYTPSPTVLAHA